MKNLLMDPVVWIAAGIILVNFVLIVWAAKRMLAPSTGSKREQPLPFAPPSVESLNVLPLETPPPPLPVAPMSSPVTRELQDKVDLISQRLVDMQMMLNKQLSTPSVVSGTAAVAPIPPETIDRLLKIVAQVIPQVEALQRSMDGLAHPEAKAPSPGGVVIEPTAAPAAPAAMPSHPPQPGSRPAPSVIPVSQILSGQGHPPPPGAA